MFALRNLGDEKSIKALASGLTDSSALFRHEVAFVLGQVASPHAVQVSYSYQLLYSLKLHITCLLLC